MNNFREVSNDILKDWFDVRENILMNIPKQNNSYVDNQLDLLYDEFMRYLTYIMRNIIGMGFVMGWK